MGKNKASTKYRKNVPRTTVKTSDVLGSDDETLFPSGDGYDSPGSDADLNDALDRYEATQNKILLSKSGRYGKKVEFDSGDDDERQEEVLGLGSDQDDEDDDSMNESQLEFYKNQAARLQREEMGSDLEDDDQDNVEDVGVPGWGKKRSSYYNSDYEKLEGGKRAKMADKEWLAEQEEAEALVLQRRLASELDEVDVGLEFFQDVAEIQKSKPDADSEYKPKLANDREEIVKDLSKLSKREQTELFDKENPEFSGLVSDFKDKLKEMSDFVLPLEKFFQDHDHLVPKLLNDYLSTKKKLLMDYSTNMCFYMALKAKRTPVKHHPILKRLVQYRNLIKTLQILDDDWKPRLESLLERHKNGETIEFIAKVETPDVDLPDRSTKKRVKFSEEEPTNEDDKQEVDEEVDDGKRGVTYEIEKNKGLKAYRKKELKNPRVKNRMKFRKALIRRKGQISAPRTEVTRYGGEVSGIKATVSHSVKLS